MSHRERWILSLRPPEPTEAQLAKIGRRVAQTRSKAALPIRLMLPRLAWMGAAVAFSLMVGFVFGRQMPAESPPVHVASVADLGHMVFTDGSQIYGEHSTTLAVEEENDTEVRIRQGMGLAHYDIRPERKRAWRVIAGSTVVEVLGTSFDVEYTSTGTRVTNRSGSVRVTHGQTVKLLLPGDVADFMDVVVSAQPPNVPQPAPPKRMVSPSAPSPVVALQPSAETFESLFTLSDQARAQKDMALAMALLEKAVQRFPEHHDVGHAVLTMARIQQDAWGNEPAAIIHYEKALAAGLPLELEESARARLCQALYRHGEPSRFESCLHAYLQHFPDGPNAEQIQTWLRETTTLMP